MLLKSNAETEPYMSVNTKNGSQERTAGELLLE